MSVKVRCYIVYIVIRNICMPAYSRNYPTPTFTTKAHDSSFSWCSHQAYEWRKKIWSQWLYVWYRCWCQMSWFKYFRNCLISYISLLYISKSLHRLTSTAWIHRPKLPCVYSSCWWRWWWGMFSWSTLSPLIPIEHRLNAYFIKATSSMIMWHITKHKWSQFASMTMSSLYFNGLPSH